MIKISEIPLRKILLSIVPDETIKSGKRPLNLFSGWNKKTFDALETINKEREQDPENNIYYIMLNREYMVIDADEKRSYNIIVNYLKSNNLYNEEAITKSYRGKTKNIYYKRHFWFKVLDQRQFKHIKTTGQIKASKDCEIFFDNGGFIGEFRDTIINNIPEMTNAIYNDIIEELTTEKELKSKEMEKIEILSDSEDDEPVEKVKKVVKPIVNDEEHNKLWLILDGLDHKRSSSYEYWKNIYCAFVNDKLPLELFEKFSKKSSSNYNKEHNEKILKGIQPKNKGYTIATIYFYLKEDNPELFKKLCSNHDGFWKNDLSENSIARLYYNMFPNDYIFNTSLGWFEYNNNNVLISRGKEMPLKLLQHLSSGLQELIVSYRDGIQFNDPQFKEKNDFIGKFHKLVGKTKFKKDCIIELSSYYNDDELINKLHKVNLLAFNNCVYDIEKNVYRPILKEDYISLTTGYDLKYTIKNGVIIPDVDLKMKSKIKEIIKSIFENKEIEKFWFYTTACCLFGNVKERFYIHSGRGGGNGKGLTQQILSNCLGKYYKQVSSNFLMGSINTGCADPELAQTMGIRYISVNEPDDTQNKKFNSPKLKELSGKNKVSVRGLYKDPFDFLPQFTINVSVNEIPKMGVIDGGVKRRINIINYPFEFRDPEKIVNPEIQKPISYELKDKFIYNQDFIQSVIVLLIHKAHKYNNKDFKTPKAITEKNNDYCNKNNELYDWFDEILEHTNNKNDKIQSGDLLEHYNQSRHCLRKLRPVDFSKYMEQFGVEKSGRTSKGYYYLGVKFRQFEMEDGGDLDA